MAILINDVAPSPISLVGAGSHALNRDRARLWRYWAGTSSAVREGFDEVYQDLESQMLPQMFDTHDTMLLGAHRSIIRQRLRQDLAVALTVTEETIDHSVVTAVSRAQSAHLAHLQRIGARIPTGAELSAIRTRVLDGLNREFPPGSGMSFRDRMDRLRMVHTNQLSNIVGSTHLRGNARNKILRDSRYALLYEGPGNTPVRGGSLYRQSRRLLVAEQTRAANAVEIETARQAGVEYAYWRLSPEHIWYGGNEICEVYANAINQNLRDEIIIGGRSPSTGMLRGLYRLDDWPMYPHPFCKCHSEPAAF